MSLLGSSDLRSLFRLLTACAGMLILVAACYQQPAKSGSGRLLGPGRALGDGDVAAYAEFDEAGAPTRIGVVLSAGALDGLPRTHSDGNRCFDSDGNGNIDLVRECSHWHEFVLPLPSEASRRADIPFKWALLNWNPYGHIPDDVWDSPHFDVHFYIEPIENVFAIQRGTCGAEFVRCDQYQRAIKPVPTNFIHPDFRDVGAVAPAMGNHLIDPNTPEFNGEAFTRHWIFGSYDGRIIFYEEMVARDYLLSQPDACFVIKTAPAVELSGYYPTRSCIRYAQDRDEYTVSMEGFVSRKASLPAAQ